MKYLNFILLLISVSVSAQVTFPIRGPLQQVYKIGASNDTTKIYHFGGSAKFYTSQDSFNFNKPLYINNVAVSGSGGVTPIDNIFDWQTNKYGYYPDSTGTGAVGGWYLGTQNPLKTTRYNFNGLLQPTKLQLTVASGIGLYAINNGTGVGLGVENMSSGRGVEIYNDNAGKALYINNSGTGEGAFFLNISTGSAISISNQSTGNAIIVNDGITTKASIDKDGLLHSNIPHAALFRNTDLTISATQNIWYKLSGMTSKDADYMTVQGDSIRLDKAGHYLITFNISFSGLNNEIWELATFKNNTLEEPSALRYTSTSDVGNMSAPVYVSSDGDDWFSFRIRNTIDGDDPTIKRISIIISTIHLSL